MRVNSRYKYGVLGLFACLRAQICLGDDTKDTADMSLPPGFIDELRTRLSLAQVVGRKVAWDMRKSNQAKGDFWAPCPFHQEKSASFHVDDQKGFYYCFGCQAKGDMISFIRETENVGFMDAVQILASEAGVDLPAPDPEVRQKIDRNARLTEVMEAAVRFYRLQLAGAGGQAARAYLQGRDLDAGTLDRWQIGFAPDDWQGLWDHLRGKGVAADLIAQAGLCKESTKGGKPYDSFRNRIMFPIRDGRDRCIAFGGRALGKDEPAKYLNSPQTPIFDKGRTLFNLGPARAAVGKGNPLVVAEGYMDVIALERAGYAGAVAPLGTAITLNQLELLWRITSEPIVALDGDKAGLRAAYRLIDLALPQLQPGRSLRFALMPEGRDPDDLLRAGGAGAVADVIEAAKPMISILWQRETEGQAIDSPDRRAALDKRLKSHIGTIPDPVLRGYYEREVKDLSWQNFGRKPAPRNWKARGAGPALAPTHSTRESLLVKEDHPEDLVREAVILAVLIRNPEVLEEFATPLEETEFSGPGYGRVRDALLAAEACGSGALGEHLERTELGPTLDGLFNHPHVRIIRAVRDPHPDRARLCLAGEFARLSARRGHIRELQEAIEDLSQGGGEHIVRRLALSAKSNNEAGRTGATDDSTRFDRGANGHPIDKEERGALDQLLHDITYAKGKGPAQ